MVRSSDVNVKCMYQSDLIIGTDVLAARSKSYLTGRVR
jgi:hypothetical protein